MRIRINGEVHEVDEVNDYGYLPEVVIGKRSYYLAESYEDAGEAARKYWEELAENDPDEFVAIVGTESLVQWALGNYAGPGSTQVQNLDEWLDLYLNAPEEEFASYDGTTIEDVRVSKSLQYELGFDNYDNIVAFRHN